MTAYRELENYEIPFLGEALICDSWNSPEEDYKGFHVNIAPNMQNTEGIKVLFGNSQIKDVLYIAQNLRNYSEAKARLEGFLDARLRGSSLDSQFENRDKPGWIDKFLVSSGRSCFKVPCQSMKETQEQLRIVRESK